MNPRALRAQLLCALLFATTTIGAQDPVVETPAENPSEESRSGLSVLDVTVSAQKVTMRLIDPEGASVEAFVKAVASVTGEVYLFDGGVLEQVADRRVKFLGTLSIDRGRVADTAAALLRTVGVRDSLEVDGDGQPIHRLRLREIPAPDSIDEVTDTFSVKLDADTVRLSIVSEEGGDPAELLEIVEFLEGTAFVYHGGEFPERAPAIVVQGQRAARGRNRNNNNNPAGPQSRVHFVGEIAIPRDRILPRAAALLGTAGWFLVPMRLGAFDVMEVVYVNGPHRQTLASRPVQVSFDKVAELKDWTYLNVATSLPLSHTNANSAAAQTRPFFSMMGNQGHQVVISPIGDDGNALLISGPVHLVATAVELIRGADQPSRSTSTTRLVTLEHLDEQRAVMILTQLFPEPRMGPQGGVSDPVRIVAQGPRRIVIAGPSSRVNDVLDAIATIDIKDVEPKK